MRAALVVVAVAALGVVVAPVRAQPASTLPFDVQSGRGSDGLVFEAPAASPGPTRWRRTIRIVVAGEAKQSTEKLQIKDCLVETDAGVAATLRPAAQPPSQDLLPVASIPIELAGEFPEAGVYKGELLLVQETRLRVVLIRVTIVGPPAPPAPPPLPIQSHGGGAVSLSGDEETAWQLEILNTGRVRLNLDWSVAAIARLDKVDSLTYRMKVPGANTAMDHTSIDPGKIEQLAIHTNAIGKPGIYEVEVLLHDMTGTHAPSSVMTIVYRKRSWYWAALMIGFGAALAFAVRWYFEGGQTYMNQRDQIRLLQKRIKIAREAAHGDTLVAAARTLEADVEERQRTLRRRDKEELKKQQEVIDRAEARLLLLQEIQTAAARVDCLEPASQGPLRKRLDEVLGAVLIDSSEGAILESRKAVTQLGDNAVWHEQLTAWLKEFEEQRAFQIPGASEKLKSALGELEEALEAVRKALAVYRLEEAHRGLKDLQPRFEEAVAAELQRLTAVEEPPLGVEAAVWKATANDIGAQLAVVHNRNTSPTVRRDAFRLAQRLYVELMVNGLASEADRKAKAHPTDAERLAAIAGELRQALRTSSVDAAARYAPLRTEIERAGRPGVQTANVGARGNEPVVRWIPRWFVVRNDVEPPPVTSPPKVLRWDRVATTTRWAVNAVVFALAIASGVKVLWVDDLAWGTCGALLTAFLWGAGVQTAGNVFSEVIAMRGKLGRSLAS